MPRVVHISTVHSARDPRILYKQCVSLRRAGYDVVLVVQHKADDSLEGIPIRALPVVAGRVRRMRLFGKAFRIAKALEPDLIHFHDPELIPVCRALKRSTAAAVVYDMHEDYAAFGRIKGRVVRALERWCFRWVDHVVVANELHVTIVEHARTTVIPNYAIAGLDRHELPQAVNRRDTMRLVYSGAVSEERGLTELLALAEEVTRQESPVEIVLIGICYIARERDRANLRIRRNGLTHPVFQLTGWETYVPWPDILLAHQAADVGLVLWEPVGDHGTKIPTKFYEYLQAGLPILCSDIPLWRSFMETHACGLVVDPRDSKGILQILHRWSENPEEYAALSQNAIRAAKHFEWDVAENRLVGLYASLLGRPSGHPEQSDEHP